MDLGSEAFNLNLEDNWGLDFGSNSDLVEVFMCCFGWILVS